MMMRPNVAGRRSAGTSTPVSQASGTVIGNMTAGGGLAAAFDGTTSQTAANGALRSPSSAGYANTVGKDWGSGVSKIIDRVRLTACSNAAVLGVGGGTTFKLQGSNDNSAWTDLYTSGTVLATSGSTVDVTSGITAGSYRYHRVNFSGNGANDAQVAEVEFWETL